MDTIDQETIRYVSTTAGILGGTIRRLMVEVMEARFVAKVTPHPMEWMINNGSFCTARETIEKAYALGMIPCFTPIRSQSPGAGYPVY